MSFSLFFSLSLWCPSLKKTFSSILLFLQPPLFHTNALLFFTFLAHFLPPLVCCHEVLLHPVFTFRSLCLSLFSPCIWLCPIALLAKQWADETVLNSVICQHIQPRKLYCRTCFFLCVCVRVYASTELHTVHICCTMRMLPLLWCILFSAYDHFCVCTHVYNATAPWCTISWNVGVATHWDC